MKPITPVIPGKAVPVTVFGEGQPQYQPLPALRCNDEAHTVVSRWRLTFAERIRVAIFGDIWLSLMTFGQGTTLEIFGISRMGCRWDSWSMCRSRCVSVTSGDERSLELTGGDRL